MDFKPTEFLISEDHITTVVDTYAKSRTENRRNEFLEFYAVVILNAA